MKLNKEQQTVRDHGEGPLLVAAVPGSGKTRCIVERMKALIDSGVDRSQILAVTFTNKAANEMKDRLDKEGYPIGKLTVSTFHSLCAQILRKCGTMIGFTEKFNIYDDKDQTRHMKKILKELGYIYTKKELEKYEEAGEVVVALNNDDMVHMAETVKNSVMTMEEVENTYCDEQVKAFKLYQSRLKKQNAMDFTDLLTNVNKLFADYPRIASHYSKQWKYILVDEVQDTNKAQYSILQHLMREHQNVVCVGDSDQSIYGWRGAYPENMMEFISTYNPKVVKLETNYRSTPEILDAAYNLISHNSNRIDVHLRTNNSPTDGPHYLPVSDNRKEGELLIKLIRKHMLEDGFSYSDFAILYRTNAISHEFESACRLHGIPYKVYGGFGFFDRKEIKACLSYMKFLSNPKDVLSFSSCMSEPKRGLGDVAQIKVTKETFRSGKSVLELCQNPPTKGKNRVNKRQAASLKEFAEIFEQVDWDNPKNYVRDVIEDSGMIEAYDETDRAKNENRAENVLELLNSFEYWMTQNPNRSLSEYLQEIQLASNEEEDVDEDHVKLMTIHSAKGLEFPVVMMTGMEEKLLPHKLALEESGPQEERRLAYVAMTRAMKYLYLTRAEYRFSNRKMNETIPSRFLYEAGFIDEVEDEWIE